jgi:glycosyltransferase involved in cell wall biosynthesis
LIRAAPKVLAKHPSARIVIVGDGPERARLEQLAIDLHVSAAVEFAGYQVDPSGLIKRMDLVVMPSIYDPFPLVTLEVMALGRPIVGSAVGGIPEAVQDGLTDLIVARAILTRSRRRWISLLDRPEERVQMGAAGRARAMREFSPETITAQYAALYLRLLVATSS